MRRAQTNIVWEPYEDYIVRKKMEEAALKRIFEKHPEQLESLCRVIVKVLKARKVTVHYISLPQRS